MSIKSHHIQLRLSTAQKEKLEALTRKYQMSHAQIIRAGLFFGLPAFETMMDLQKELAGRFLKMLKKDSRSRDTRIEQQIQNHSDFNNQT